jgi:hypothetical protein
VILQPGNEHALLWAAEFAAGGGFAVTSLHFHERNLLKLGRSLKDAGVAGAHRRLAGL